jgi:glutathione S-transferase
MAITVYGVYRSRATRNIWLLGELGLPFVHVPVIQANRVAKPKAKDAPLNTQSRKFLKVNPNGQIPSLKDGRLVLHESLAINLYLARKYGKKQGTKLGPGNVAEEGQMAMWTLWAATACEPHTIQVLYNTIGKPEPERVPAMAAAAAAALQAPFDVLDAHLAAEGGFTVGKRFTVADINLAEVIRYAQPMPELFATRPSLKAWIEACQARPAFKAMMVKRNAEPM